MSTAAKDTLYIDIEDEITAVIDKVVTSKNKIVALVLPKHAAVFQSTVNLKLLKKAAQSSKKNLVFITSDKAVLAIAGTVGLHVAKSLSTKPEIPQPMATQEEDDTVSESLEGDDSTGVAVAATAESDDSEATIELDNTPETSIISRSKKKLMKIPDFSKFSVRLTLGVLLVLLLITGWVFGFVVLPKATITVNTDTMTSAVNAKMTARIGAEAVDLENNTIPAKRAQVEKTDTVTIQATGQKNIGENAKGSVTLTNCINDGEKKIIPAGTQFSSGSLSFLTVAAVTLNAAYFDDGTCKSAELPAAFGTYKDVEVVAAQPGPEYNIPAGNLNSSISGIRAYGSAMSGGSSQIVTIVSDADVKTAEDQLRGSSKAQALVELREQLKTQGVEPLDQTIGEGEQKVDVVPAVGAESSELKVTMVITYNLTGIAMSDVSKILDSEVRKILGDSPQNIRDNGLSTVVFLLTDSPNESDKNFTIETVAKIGPDLNEQTLRNSAVGKKRGEIEKEIEAIEGVRSVSVEYSPAWITTTPKSAEKISIIFVEDDGEE